MRRTTIAVLAIAVFAPALNAQPKTYTVVFPGVAKGVGWAQIDPQGTSNVADLALGLTLTLQDGKYVGVSRCGARVRLEVAAGLAIVVVSDVAGKAPQVGGHWIAPLKGGPTLTLGLDPGWDPPNATFVVWPNSITIK